METPKQYEIGMHPQINKTMALQDEYEFLDQLFVRSPFYSPDDYAPDQIRQVMRRADFRNALWLASPGFYQVLEKMQFNWDLLGKSERLSLLKYYNRMSFRATPFGAFSAFSLVPWDAGDRVRLVEKGRSMLHLLPSWEWLQARRTRFQKEQTDYYLLGNPTLFRIGDRLSFIRSETDGDGKMQFSLNGITAEALNLRIIKLAEKKPMLKSVIRDMICRLTGCSEEEGSVYLEFLIAEQVLLTEFTGSLIEGAPGPSGAGCWQRIHSVPFTDALDLNSVSGELFVKDKPDPFAGNQFYSALERPIQAGGVALECQQDILAVIKLLGKIVIPYPTPALEVFSSAFRARFEDQKIPLLAALDPDTGVGYDDLFGSPGQNELLKDLPFPATASETRRIDWTPVHQLFFRLWQQKPGALPHDPLVIRDADLEELDKGQPQVALPPSLAFLFSRTADQLVLDNIGGASATALVGRFSAFSTSVTALCRGIASAEIQANPDVIFAEIDQLSDSHVDNINRRRAIYDHIIPINTYAGTSAQTVIPLSDLVVSVRAGNIIMESVRLGKRIIPRLPTAFNFHHNQLAVFRFLGDLQFHGLQANLTFDLEKLFPGAEHYPRIVYRKVIIAAAKWRLSAREVGPLTGKKQSLGALHLLRQQRGIPAWVTMGVSDRQLTFDLACDEQAMFFLECLKEQNTVLIREYIHSGDFLKGGKQKLAGQYIALLTKKSNVYRGMSSETPDRAGHLQRDFVPGSEWIYFKIYCTDESAGHLLSTFIQPFISANGIKIKCWFFIRYYDPGSHIRLRILTSAKNYGPLVKSIRRELSKSPVCFRVQHLSLETYQREIERYGAETMGFSESCFYKGSVLAVNWLTAAADKQNDLSLSAFRLVHIMTNLFISDPALRLQFYHERSRSFMAEFGGHKEFRLSLDRKYRALYKLLSTELQQDLSSAQPVAEQEFYASVRVIAEQTKPWPCDKRLRLLADLAHMQVNRLFNSRQRQHEALIFFCLAKYTASELAR
nr:lantibiotic dehydratase [Mucilaginibacter sp. L294]